MSGFSRLRTSTPNTPAQAPAPAPAPKQEKAPAPAPQVPATPAVTVPADAPRGLTLPTKANVLAVVSASAEEGGKFVEAFPTLVIKGGNAGGTMAPSTGTDKEVGDQLPQGKQPVKAVFMAFRVMANAWPTEFEQKQEGDRPSIDAAISCNDAEGTRMLLTACENFQFCPRDNKPKWAVSNGGPGYLRPIFQMLVYLPQFDDVIILQTPGLLKSWQTMSQILNGMADAEGNLVPFPAVFQTKTAPWYEDNVYHYFDIATQANAEGKDWMAKYNQFIATLKEQRPELVQAINDWFTCADKPLDGVNHDRLAQAAAMVNPRRARR